MSEEAESYKTPVVATNENPPVIDTTGAGNKLSGGNGSVTNSSSASAAAAAAAAVAAQVANANVSAVNAANVAGGGGATQGGGSSGQVAEIGPVWPSPGPPVEDFNYFFNSALGFQQNGYFFQNFGPPPNMSKGA